MNASDTANPAADPFDRQRRIGWWDQSVVERARVVVCGAGAIGNETLKNLVLLGFRDISIWDLDAVESSNLSRTVLFRASDVGLPKAVVAAQRARELSPSADCRIEGYVGDVVWDLGLGTIRDATVVLGCLDNVEARRAMNRFCKLTGKTFLDAGIAELETRVSVFAPGDAGCFECGLSDRSMKQSRRRYSCKIVMRDAIERDLVPTAIVAAALCGALQVQETVKLLHRDERASSYCVRYWGSSHHIETYAIHARGACEEHGQLPAPRPISANAATSLRAFLGIVSKQDASGLGAVLDLSTERDFVVTGTCLTCGKAFSVGKPGFRCRETDLRCPYGDHGNGVPDVVSRFSLTSTDVSILDRTLAEIGVPRRHVLPVMRLDGEYDYYELSG